METVSNYQNDASNYQKRGYLSTILQNRDARVDNLKA